MDTDKVLLVTGGSRGIGAAGVARIFDTVDDVKLPLTGFVNNAGIVGQIAPFTECTRERLQRTFNVNILSALECAQQAVTRMLLHGQGGAIANVSSAAARIGSLNEFIRLPRQQGRHRYPDSGTDKGVWSAGRSGQRGKARYHRYVDLRCRRRRGMSRALLRTSALASGR